MNRRDYHTKPLPNERTIEDALWLAEKKREELPMVVQVYARDWDPIILADEVYRLRKELETLKGIK